MNSILRMFAPWAWAAIAGVVLFVAILLLSFCTARDRARDEAAKATAAGAFADARAKAGSDAVNIVTGNAEKSATIDARVKGSEDAIRNAPPADRDRAALRELCQSPSARNRPECRVQ